MRVQFSVVGNIDPYDGPEWGDLAAIPRRGEWLHLPGLPSDLSCVREVVWYPFGDPEAPENGVEPFVYLVIGPHRS